MKRLPISAFQNVLKLWRAEEIGGTVRMHHSMEDAMKGGCVFSGLIRFVCDKGAHFRLFLFMSFIIPLLMVCSGAASPLYLWALQKGLDSTQALPTPEEV